jgi:hypothetical protein
MDNVRKKIRKETIAICTLSFVLLFMITITITYSYLSSNVNEASVGSMSASSAKGETLLFLKGETINQLIETEDNTHRAITRPVVVYTADSKNNGSTTYNGYINIKNNNIVRSEDNSEAINLKIKKPDGTYVNSINGLNFNVENNVFDITNKTGVFKFANNYEISADKGKETVHTWEIEIIVSDSAVNINKNASNEIDTDITFVKGEYEG